MHRLIVNADDFGYTPGVNRAIIELYAQGVLTSTTLMAQGAAFEDALDRLASLPALSRPALGVGCHVVLVDGRPVAPADRIASLLSASRGAGVADQPAPFRPTLGAFVADLVAGRIREVEIEEEAIAQIRKLQARGVSVTHLDTHKHTHMFPRVLRPLVRAALQCGVRAIRNPFEPSWSTAATSSAPFVRRLEVRLLGLLRPPFHRLVTEAGLETTAGALGVLATGTLDGATLERLLQAASEGDVTSDNTLDTSWELVCHPGYHDAALAAQPTRLRHAREVERAAFMAAAPWLKRFSLIDFAAFSGR